MTDLDVVQLTDRRHYEWKIDRTRWLYLRPLNPTITGVGWPGWDASKSVVENLENVHGRMPDVLDVYKPLDYFGFDELPESTVTVTQYNEVKPAKWKKEVKQSKMDLLVFRHINDWDKWKDQVEQWTGADCVHIPHVAPQDVFYPRNVKNEHDFVCIGASGGKIYPLRSTLHQAGQILSQRGYRYFYKVHPGNEIKNASSCWHLDHLAQIISSSRIVGTSSSTYRYRLGKYPEVAACGTALAADRPESRELMPHLIEINRKSTPEQIADQLEGVLESGKDEEYARKGLEYAAGYTCEWYAQEYERAVKELL